MGTGHIKKSITRWHEMLESRDMSILNELLVRGGGISLTCGIYTLFRQAGGVFYFDQRHTGL